MAIAGSDTAAAVTITSLITPLSSGPASSPATQQPRASVDQEKHDPEDGERRSE